MPILYNINGEQYLSQLIFLKELLMPIILKEVSEE